MKDFSWILLSLVFVVAGALHFLRPRLYLKIMPPALPRPLLLVYLSGLAELFLGAALWIPELRVRAAWGLIALLIAVFPANLYMFRKGGAAFGVPTWLLGARLPLQGILVAWAYWHTR